ncbi:uncharacterized protein LOC105181996 [Harpegnathos saltator]|uniref:uncharacterized protein LOC105181996 n=1 Tax=Harpegnathos saltator TaxID=610380 RepID=UPI000DBEE65A|nr:uncharacterized protein LOC105181996 [Harpegnathos saltator]
MLFMPSMGVTNEFRNETYVIRDNQPKHRSRIQQCWEYLLNFFRNSNSEEEVESITYRYVKTPENLMEEDLAPVSSSEYRPIYSQNVSSAPNFVKRCHMCNLLDLKVHQVKESSNYSLIELLRINIDSLELCYFLMNTYAFSYQPSFGNSNYLKYLSDIKIQKICLNKIDEQLGKLICWRDNDFYMKRHADLIFKEEVQSINLEEYYSKNFFSIHNIPTPNEVFEEDQSEIF